jgi:serine protease Do
MFEVEPQQRRVGFMPYLFGGLTGAGIGLLIVAAVLLARTPRNVQQTEGAAKTVPVQYASIPHTQTSIDESRRNAIVSATEMVAPAVVNVTVTRTQTYREIPWFWEDLFGRNWPVKQRKVGGYGSGVIIRPDGYVLTNEHVIHLAEDIWVTLSRGETMKARLVGSAENYDLALLKVESTDLPYAKLGDSDDLLVGEWAIAIGSPFGHLLEDTHPTVTVGVVSAFNRDVKPEASNQRILMDLIQTDAAINPGNSGGPLVNSSGEVVGINTAIFSRSGGSEGIGFAIPINRGKWVVDEILTHGRVRPVYMGMTGIDLTPELAASLDLRDAQGVLVQEIREDGPAYRAGIRAGDLLVSINGIRVRDIDHVNRIVYPAKVGEELDIEINRKGKLTTAKLILEERPQNI